jgi:hypothetical protein
MSNLLKLKEWLTVAEAAARLSGVFEEKVTEADILRLALDRKLTLSIRFKDDVVIRPCKLLRHDEVALKDAVETVSDFSTNEGRQINCKKLDIDDDQCLVFDGEMAISDGLWDLPMIGNEKYIIEDRCSHLSGGAFAGDGCHAGILISKNGLTAQLQVHFIHSKHHWMPTDSVVSTLYKKIVLVKDVITEMSRPREMNYIPAYELPYSAELVVSSAAFRDFEDSIFGNSSSPPTLLATTERHTLLKQIGALSLVLAEQTKKFKRGEKPNGLQIANAAGEIVDALPGANSAGIGASSIRESIRQGIELLTAIQR